MIKPRGIALALSATLILTVGGCGKDSPSQQTTGPYAVGTRRLHLVDEGRSTPGLGGAPATPTRTVDTDVWYPAAGDPAAPAAVDPPAADGPFPVIVFNHGQQGDPQQYTLAFELWTRAGYVVVAPRHPITVTGGPGGHFVDDIAGEVGDTPFVIDQLDEQLGDLVDLDHLAVAGHSSGAINAYAAGFNTCCTVDRVDAVLVQGFLKIPLDGDYADGLKGTPLMMQHGTADEYPIAGARAEYDAAQAPKWFLTIDGGNHSEDFRVGPRAEVAAQAALQFFELTLKGRDAGRDALAQMEGIDADPG